MRVSLSYVAGVLLIYGMIRPYKQHFNPKMRLKCLHHFPNAEDLRAQMIAIMRDALRLRTIVNSYADPEGTGIFALLAAEANTCIAHLEAWSNVEGRDMCSFCMNILGYDLEEVTRRRRKLLEHTGKR